jgi:prepilin-type N-terminal cleavage/methylation domain-containing protein
MMRDKLNNQGFTLIELIISIAILVIILVPLMGNFIRSIQVNKKAGKLQIQSNLASSIMEGLKSYGIDEIIARFNGSSDDFDLIACPVEDVMRLEEDGTGGFKESFLNTHGASYYFALNGIREGRQVYDAFITMEAEPYKLGGSDTGIMNNYPMPDIINLDEKANCLFYSEGSTDSGMRDEDVLNTYIAWGRAHAQTELYNSTEYKDYLAELADYKSREVEGNLLPGELPPDEPALNNLPASLSYLSVFFVPEEVTGLISKTMNISAVNDTISYDIEYYCNWSSGSVERSIVHNVSDVRYPEGMSSIYLFYKPSVFSLSRSDTEEPADRIYISNGAENTLDFYVALQEDKSGHNWNNWSNKAEISANGDIKLYTNIPPSCYNPGGTIGAANPNLINSKATNRIYAVKVDICRHVNDPDPNSRYNNILYTLQSSIEY